MRALTACAACRSRRRKCELQRGTNTCTYCSERGITCIRKEPSYGSTSPGSGPDSSVVVHRPIENGLELPPPALCMELVELYFDLIHNQFHALFHPPSFIEDVRQGVAPRTILFAMMALSARFSTNPAFSGIAPRERSKVYYNESAKLLDIRDTSLVTIQACVLLGAISTTEDNAITESVYYTVACRMAHLLDLSKKTASDAIEQEVNMRVWWTLCMVDVWSSKSVSLPRQMVHLEHLPLPIDEATFLQWRRGTKSDPDSCFDRRLSLLAQMITLNRILLEINDAIARTAASSTTSLVLAQTVQDLSQKLDDWYNALPECMHDTPENLNTYASQGLGRLFVAVYLGYYHFGQLLFYQFLHQDQRSSGGNNLANKCKAHAASLCNMVYVAHSTPGCEVWYNMVGHILVIASTVQIHTLLFGSDEAEISVARARLERNFEILTRLRSYWPMLDMCFARLQIFHEVCRKSMDTSFRMDQWMLKFLSEFAEPIEEKMEDSEVLGLDSVLNVGVSPQDWV